MILQHPPLCAHIVWIHKQSWAALSAASVGYLVLRTLCPVKWSHWVLTDAKAFKNINGVSDAIDGLGHVAK